MYVTGFTDKLRLAWAEHASNGAILTKMSIENNSKLYPKTES